MQKVGTKPIVYHSKKFPGWKFRYYDFTAPWPWKFEAILEFAGIAAKVLIALVTFAVMGGAIIAAVIKFFKGV